MNVKEQTITENSSPGNGTATNAVPPTGADSLPSDLVTTFLDVLGREKAALQAAAQKLTGEPEAIAKAGRVLLFAHHATSPGRVIASGMGKAGLIARKVASTLSSIGTAAVFLHPVDALHGDLGFVRNGDCGLFFSYSGETVEVVRLAGEMYRTGCPLIVITRSRDSSLGKIATACLEMGDVREACYLGLAPSCSTTIMLAIGDALALTVAKANGFSEKDFGRNHPAGSLGLRFRSVRDLMRTGNRLVRVQPNTKLKEVIRLVSDAKTGAAVVVRPDGGLLGLFTDGDLRRAVLKGSMVMEQEIEKFASIPCYSVRADSSVAEALKLFHNTRIEDLPVVDRQTGQVLGLLCLKDIAVF